MLSCLYLRIIVRQLTNRSTCVIKETTHYQGFQNIFDTTNHYMSYQLDIEQHHLSQELFSFCNQSIRSRMQLRENIVTYISNKAINIALRAHLSRGI